MKYLYLIQASSCLPEGYAFLRNTGRDFILLSFNENSSDSSIFYPNSTWATRRNKLREYVFVRGLECRYDYIIFLDEDVTFLERDNEAGVRDFERLLEECLPIVASPQSIQDPLVDEKYKSCLSNATDLAGGLTAFSREAFQTAQVFPYFIKSPEGCCKQSQFMMSILCQLYFTNGVLVSQKLKINSPSRMDEALSRDTDDFNPSLKAVRRNLLLQSRFHEISQWQKIENIFDIAAFLRQLFRTFDLVNLIDVGSASGDFNFILGLPQVYSLGIDPLIEEYTARNDHSLHLYHKLLDLAVDVSESESIFNITDSLDTSSLKEFNSESITTDDHLVSNVTQSIFYIPAQVKDRITTVISQKVVHTKRLDTILREENLAHTIIHILKIDAQGNDLNVLKSCGEMLKNVMFIVVESTYDEAATLYKDSSKFAEDDNYLTSAGFRLVAKAQLLKHDCDCLYMNTRMLVDDSRLSEVMQRREREVHIAV